MSVTTLTWSDIEVEGKSTGKYLCSQHLNALLRNNEKSHALQHKFILQKCVEELQETTENSRYYLDMTLEHVLVERVPRDWNSLLTDHSFIVNFNFNGFMCHNYPSLYAFNDGCSGHAATNA